MPKEILSLWLAMRAAFTCQPRHCACRDQSFAKANVLFTMYVPLILSVVCQKLVSPEQTCSQKMMSLFLACSYNALARLLREHTSRAFLASSIFSFVSLTHVAYYPFPGDLWFWVSHFTSPNEFFFICASGKLLSFSKCSREACFGGYFVGHWLLHGF